METEVHTSKQIPVSESTGIDVPGQLWKRYHMEKASIVANLNTTVEMGSPIRKVLRKTFLLILQVALFKIFQIVYRMVC